MKNNSHSRNITPIRNKGWGMVLLSLTVYLVLAGCSKKQEAKTETAQPATEAKKNEAVTIQPQMERDTLKGSLKAMVTGRIGSTFVTINYHSPAVRGRMIWGGLVPFDQVWATGAHTATRIEFEGPVKIGNQEIKAGKYAIFSIPSQNEWTMIINKNWEQHLADEYDQKDDLVRIKVKPKMENVNQERLQYAVNTKTDTEGEIVMYWEKLKVSLPVNTLK